MKRKSITPKIRFEVFKRDKFTCKYCGGKAPDTVLEVDHINPVNNGGDNSILNLLTSCFKCNRGKGKRLLNDNTHVALKRAELEHLQEKLWQMRMMVEWHNELKEAEEEMIGQITDYLESFSEYIPNQNGIKIIKKWLKEYRPDDILIAIDQSFDSYYIEYEDESLTRGSWCKAFDKVFSFLKINEKTKTEPFFSEYAYIQGILRNTTGDKYGRFIEKIQAIHENGMPLDDIKFFAKEIDTVEEFNHIYNSTLQSQVSISHQNSDNILTQQFND